MEALRLGVDDLDEADLFEVALLLVVLLLLVDLVLHEQEVPLECLRLRDLLLVDVVVHHHVVFEATALVELGHKEQLRHLLGRVPKHAAENTLALAHLVYHHFVLVVQHTCKVICAVHISDHSFFGV